MRQLFFIFFIFILSGPVSAFAQDAEIDTRGEIRYRSIIYFYPDAKLPSQKDLSKHLRDFARVEVLPEDITKPVVSLSFLDDFDDSYPVPDQDQLVYFGRGLSKEQADAIQASENILVVDVAYPQNMYLSGYEPVVDFIHLIAKKHDGLIWDSETRELFEPKAWESKRLANYDGFPNVANHITIHAYNNGDSNENSGIRAITLGMSKFGHPDVVINNFSWSLNQPMGNLINLTSQSILEGLTPDENGELMLDIGTLKNAEIKQTLLKDIKANAVTKLEIKVAEAKREDGDPDNFLLEILFDKFEGTDLSEKQDHAVSELFGWEDSIFSVQHDKDILRASKNAKAKLDDLRKDFQEGFDPGEYILLKAPFTTADGGNEWMWVEVMSWDNKTIKGLLKNEPYHVQGLRAGSEVEINQEDVFDYLRKFANGTSEGNETGKIMSQQR